MKASGITVLLILAVLASPALSSAAGPMVFAPRMSIYTDEKGDGISTPEGVACNDKTVVVADSGNGRLIKFDYSDAGLKGGTEIKLPQLPYPFRVQIDSKGNILALDGQRHRIVRVGPAGEFRGEVDPTGLPISGKPIPVGFKLDASDNVYILDAFSQSVFELDPTGKFVKQLELPKDTGGFFSDICVLPGGGLLLLDCVNAVLYSTENETKTFAPVTKGLKEYMNFPIYVTTDERGTVLLVDQNGAGIILLGQDGKYQGRQLGMGWSEGQIYYPAQICMTPGGDVFIADRGNNRVGIYSTSR